MNRKNLEKLRDGLRGELRMAFDMGLWFEAGKDVDGDSFELSPQNVCDRQEFEGDPYCGTAACALGHAHLLVAPVNVFDCSWEMYCFRVFDIKHNSPEFVWLFSFDWDGVDNTPAGAAGRIDWLLKHGVPTTAVDQMHGLLPLCYKVT